MQNLAANLELAMADWHVDALTICRTWSAEFMDLMFDAREKRMKRQKRSQGTNGKGYIPVESYLAQMGNN